MAGGRLEVQEVVVRYWNSRKRESFLALENMNLTVEPGEFVALVGVSGCGKTTLLNAVAGLLPISGGRLALNGHEMGVPGRDRAMVFQSPSLFPWRTVRGNVGYGLEIQRKPKAFVRQQADKFIRLVGLSGFEEAHPYELSGGMQQRCNLARALATDPDMLLLDEPFAALDAQTREFMQLELLKIWGASQKTALFVTHQIDEAIYLADRVVVFTARPGKVREIVNIAIPRPRPLRVKHDPLFREYEERIWTQIQEEGVKMGMFQISDDAAFT